MSPCSQIMGMIEGHSKMVSVVVPVHNEQAYLPYLLNSLEGCCVDEIIFVLDRCNDNSQQIIRKWPHPKIILNIYHKTWRSFTAEPISYGFKVASGNMIFSVGADFYLDSSIFNHDFSGIDLACFNMKTYALHETLASQIKIQGLEKVQRIYEHLRKISLRKHLRTYYLPGLYAVSRDAYQRFQHMDTFSEDYTLQEQLIKNGFNVRYYDSNTLHLRPLGSQYAVERGHTTYERLGKIAAHKMGLARMFWMNLRLLDKSFVQSYLIERRNN